MGCGCCQDDCGAAVPKVRDHAPQAVIYPQVPHWWEQRSSRMAAAPCPTWYQRWERVWVAVTTCSGCTWNPILGKCFIRGKCDLWAWERKLRKPLPLCNCLKWNTTVHIINFGGLSRIWCTPVMRAKCEILGRLSTKQHSLGLCILSLHHLAKNSAVIR